MKSVDDVYRKLKIRNEAQENINYLDEKELESIKKLHENIITANSIWNIDYDFEIYSHRKFLGKIIVFSKRAIRKLLKWYVRDTGIKQNTFNAYTVKTLNGIWEYINEANNKMEIQDNKINVQQKQIINQIEEISKLNNIIRLHEKKYVKDMDNLEQELSKLNNIIKLQYEEHIKNINNLMEDTGYLRYKINSINISNDSLEHNNDKLIQTKSSSNNNDIYKIDYFDFENKFRGSEEDTLKRQEIYLPYFENVRGEVLDIGCGRGEFLTMLSKNNIPCKGVDIYPEFVSYCKFKNLDIECSDAIEFLNNVDDNSFGGIFVGQVAEHLETDYLIELINICRNKVVAGGKVIFETPNPETIRILGDTFYVDPSHIKPIHPLQLKYIFESARFKNIQTLYLHEFDEKIPHIVGVENQEEMNASIDKLNRLLYGPRDYAIIGEK